MAAHDRLDGLGGFVGVVEWNGRDVMVQDVGFDDAVEQITANESKLAVNGGRRSAGKAPRLGSVMSDRGIGMLQVRDCNLGIQSVSLLSTEIDVAVGPKRRSLPSQ